MKQYIFSEDVKEGYPVLYGLELTQAQLKEVYDAIIDKVEYPDFECWFLDMKKSNLIIEAMG